MPNWCFNTLHVAGPPEAVQTLVDAVRGHLHGIEDYDVTALSLHAIEPRPGDVEHGVNWSQAHWGTKWDVDASLHEGDSEGEDMRVVFYEFDSAWSPPVEAMLTLSNQHPKVVLHLRYDEPGMGFAGFALIARGEICEEMQTESPGQLDFSTYIAAQHLKGE